MITKLDHFSLNNSNAKDKIAFHFLNEDLSVRNAMTYGRLELAVDDISSRLPQISSPLLLLFEDVVEFIVAFLACEKAGLISIPMFYPKSKRHFQRLQNILSDSQCEIVLCEQKNKSKITEGLKINDSHILEIYSLDDIKKREAVGIERGKHECVFIQYTSGSTASPKGVMITNDNLDTNQKMIQKLFGCDENSIILSWLPFYHDMGLIGSILHSLYVGATCVIMPSVVAIQSTFRWLEAISTFKVTHSGGPNFMYDLCVNQIDDNRLQELDLSSWEVAYNGSEPIKKSTIESFISKFQKCGFNPTCYYTCYGLAEATLLVSGGKYVDQLEDPISSGRVCNEIEVHLLDSKTGKINQTEGEIVLHGKSVTTGYWNKDNSDLFVEINGKKYLKTGDLGSFVNSELIVTGRLKELIIINGKNYFPYEIENSISESVSVVDNNGVIVSFIEDENSEKPIVFAEIKKSELSNLNPVQIFNQIDRLVIELIGVETFDILLFTPRKLARTSSGKLQRIKTKESYLQQSLDFLQAKKMNIYSIESIENEWVESILSDGEYNNVKNYLIVVLNNKLKTTLSVDSFNQNLMDLGIDSLRSVDLINTINSDLELNIDIIALMNLTTTVDFEELIKNLIWMKSTESTGEEIII